MRRRCRRLSQPMPSLPLHGPSLAGPAGHRKGKIPHHYRKAALGAAKGKGGHMHDNALVRGGGLEFSFFLSSERGAVLRAARGVGGPSGDAGAKPLKRSCRQPPGPGPWSPGPGPSRSARCPRTSRARSLVNEIEDGGGWVALLVGHSHCRVPACGQAARGLQGGPRQLPAPPTPIPWLRSCLNPQPSIANIPPTPINQTKSLPPPRPTDQPRRAGR